MADQVDVEVVLSSLITSLLYPSGIGSASVLGLLCRIYRGWPNPAALNVDLASGHATVTVYPGVCEHITTRHIDPPAALSVVVPSLEAWVAGDVVTFGGVAQAGQVAGILVDNAAFVHRVVAGDTVALVAAILGSYIRTRRIAVVDGAAVRIPGAGFVVARVVADQVVQTTWRRQAQDFTITAWCPDPASRDALSALLDVGLSSRSFVDLPDGTQARLRFRRSTTFDQSQNANLYRRDLVFSAEYATTTTTTLPALIFGDTRLAADGGAARSLLS